MSSLGKTAGSGNTIAPSKSTGQPAPSSTINTAPKSSTSRNVAPSARTGRNTSLGTTAAPKPFTLETLTAKQTKQVVDEAKIREEVSTEFANFLEQKMMADLLLNMVAHEKDAFEQWAKSKGTTLKNIGDVEDFLDILETGEISNDAVLNDKFEKVKDYWGDIVGALLKNEAIAPGAKIIEGRSPTIDATKAFIEKTLSPTLQKLGRSLENRLGEGIGKQIAEGLVSWGERLATLPSEVLGAIGPADLVSSVLDLALISIDKATGNYRQKNHELADEVQGIPVVGQQISALSSIRDLLDSAAGIPNDAQAIDTISNDLRNNLWLPAIEEQNNTIANLTAQEQELEQFAERVNDAVARQGIQEEVGGKVNEVSRVLGNDRDRMLDFFRRELDYAYDPNAPSVADASAKVNSTKQKISEKEQRLRRKEQELVDQTQWVAPSRIISGIESEIKRLTNDLEKLRGELPAQEKQLEKSLANDKNQKVDELIGAIVDTELGRINQTTLENKIKGGELETPKIAETINPVEIRTRMALDNIYSMEAGLVAIDGEINSLKAQNKRLAKEANQLIAGKRFGDITGEASAKLQQVQRNKDKINQLEQSKKGLSNELTAKMVEFEDMIDDAEEQGINLDFAESSLNWEQALRDLEDDTLFWGTGVLGDITGGFL